MERMRKLASMLIAFSLFVSPLTALPSRASQLAASEAIEDPLLDAAAMGEGETTEGAASSGLQDDSEEDEEDVMATVSGETSDGGETTTGTASSGAATDSGATPIDDGETTSGTASSGAATDNGDTPIDDGETTSGTASGGGTTDTGATPIDDGETSGGGATPIDDSGASETPAEEEEEAAEGETPDEEETASSGLKEGEPDGGDSESESALPFDDVPPNHWSYPFVLYAYEHDLVKGVSETAFSPTGVMTRAAFVTVLYRLSAKIDADMTSAPTSFTDIGDINAEFQSAIAWAAAHGIVNGRTETTFAPRENVTRQQMCAILTRYLHDYLRYDLSGYQGSANFADGDSISNYAKEAVSTAQAMGIISGREADGVTIFDPTGSASRAAVVKVLSLAVQMIPDLQKLPDTPPADTGDSGHSTDTGDSGDSGNSTDTGDSGSSTDTGDSGNSSSTGNSGNSSSNGGSGGGGGNTSSHSGGNTSSHGGGNNTKTDTGDSGNSDTGDSGNSDTGDSGATGDSGNSDTGDSGDSGDSGNSDTGDSGATESPEAAVIFGYIDEALAAYEANPPSSAFVKSCMEILIPDLNTMKEARAAGEIVDSEYLRTHFPDDIQKLMDKYNLATVSELMELMDYAERLGPDRSHFIAILEYFNVMDMLR